MNRSIISALGAIVMVMIVLAILWALNLASLGSIFSGVSAGVGAVFLVSYMRRFYDERFSQIMILAARNAFVFYLFTFPLCSVVLVAVEEITLQIAAGVVFVPWILSLTIWYLSLFYYYRK
ncbi:MAG: hypothetical protein ACFFBL_07235 [Promethearchaeota archaeon]